ncbi:tail fiber protein [Paenibacillus sp. MER 99-2]|uniref:phage tail protein n=1 Tax=Paenibacillus sp. MER 99-2 TaxID=2939572 RepID=UPI00203B2230|nr:tail fiber protein [Paenibacillus sp. MER 99-2]MCM3175032.1 tail fiber protein [Paenibacillus sp. MER 99-2]
MAEPFLGEIRLFAFAYGNPPIGWAACNGQILQIKQNNALFAILGNRFGGDGKTTFALPDLQGRVPLGSTNPASASPYGGEETHTLTINEMPQHTHYATGGNDAATNIPVDSIWGNNTSIASYESVSNAAMSSNALHEAGGSTAHSNMQPYLVLNYCIAVEGIFPQMNL